MSVQTVVRPERFAANQRAVCRPRFVRSAVETEGPTDAQFVGDSFINVLYENAEKQIARPIRHAWAREGTDSANWIEREGWRSHLFAIEIPSYQKCVFASLLVEKSTCSEYLRALVLMSDVPKRITLTTLVYSFFALCIVRKGHTPVVEEPQTL